MKMLKLTALLLLSILIVSTTGCVAVTGEANPDKSYYADSTPVDSNQRFSKAIEVGSTEGFSGTNSFVLAGNVSPNLNNETAKQALEASLQQAGMLAQSGSAKYQLDAKMVDDAAKGAFGQGTTFSGMSRNMKIQYTLIDLRNTTEIYNEIITSHGEATCSDACVFYYLQERYAAERSNADSHRQLIADLKALPVD